MGKTLGEIIKTKRKEMKLTLRALADETGLSHPYLSQLENGRNRNPSYEVAIRISKTLNIPFEEIEHFVGCKKKSSLIEENKRLREALQIITNVQLDPLAMDYWNEAVSMKRIARQALGGETN